MNEWISFDRKHPPTNKKILLSDGKDIILARISKIAGMWMVQGFHEMKGKPKYWMILPPTPKEPDPLDEDDGTLHIGFGFNG